MKEPDQILELWHNKQSTRLVRRELASISEEDLLVKAHYSLVSLGTERLVLSQNLTEEIANNMRIPYMLGDLRSDFTYGYSLVGQVISGPSDMKDTFVHLMHPHQNLLKVKRQDITILPDAMNPKLATLGSNMETAVNAIWDGEVEMGDKVLVIGYGIIGALIAMLAKNIAGVEVSILEKNAKKDLAISNAGLKLFENGNNADFDVVFNTSASEEMLQKAIELSRNEGKVVEVSWYGDRSIRVNLGADFHYGRKRIICSQVSQIPLRKQPVWNYKKRKSLVFKLLQELNPIELIESEISFLDTPAFFNELRTGPIDSIGVAIKY